MHLQHKVAELKFSKRYCGRGCREPNARLIEDAQQQLSVAQRAHANEKAANSALAETLALARIASSRPGSASEALHDYLSLFQQLDCSR